MRELAIPLRPLWLFVSALLDAPPWTVENEIGTTVWGLSNDESILDYLNDQMLSGPGSRRFVVARTLWALMRGSAVAA